MTIVIASMGMLGLVVYSIETRRKEISIRKIVGAPVWKIVYLLSAGFLGLLAIASIIALPLSFIAGQFFLMNFVNKVSFGITDLLIAGVILFTIGLMAILPQTFTAASEDPVKNLRSE